ncbi:TWiK family of potassium channels protein 18 [Hermetia illucens]|nr:TWiK family of potassium channels protein 18 [Hermetia illucens]
MERSRMSLRRSKSLTRSQGSLASSSIRPRHDARRQVKDCCRKFVAFMCTQVGVGALIVAYSIIGAFCFISVETQVNNTTTDDVAILRRSYALELWEKTEHLNMFNKTEWMFEMDDVLKSFQDEVSSAIKNGFDARTPEEIWSFPAALMYCLSIFTMIGYGNIVPKTQWGKGLTVIYATFGIPLYILYFLNIGKILAKTFKILYRCIHECTHDKTEDILEQGGYIPQKKVIVPSTACLWVISFYIFTGTIMFANWERWSYLDSVYFCVTSLCKIGMGDFVPGANFYNDSITSQQTKLAINFVYVLLGMGLVAMCYNLMREEVKVKLKEMKEDLKLCLEDLRNRFTGICGSEDYEEEEW